MTIAELFLNIGIKGTPEVTKALSAVKNEFADVKEMSLAMKAGILGSALAFEELTSHAAKLGLELTKFSLATGLSTTELQKWQYMAGKFGISGEEMSSTISGIQDKIAEMQLGGGMPKALGLVNFDPKKLNDPFYILTKMSEVSKTLRPEIARNFFQSLGVSSSMFALLKSTNLEVDKYHKSYFLNAKEVAGLKEINEQWHEFWFTLQAIGNKLVASQFMQKFVQLVAGGLTGALALVEKFREGMTDLLDKFGGLKTAIEIVGAAALIAFAPLTATVAGLLLLLEDFATYQKGGISVLGGLIGHKGDTTEAKKELESAKTIVQSVPKYLQPAAALMSARSILGKAIVNKMGSTAKWFLGGSGEGKAFQGAPLMESVKKFGVEKGMAPKEAATIGKASSEVNVTQNFHGDHGTPEDHQRAAARHLGKVIDSTASRSSALPLISGAR